MNTCFVDIQVGESVLFIVFLERSVSDPSMSVDDLERMLMGLLECGST